MDTFSIRVHAGTSMTDRTVTGAEIHEELRRLGLEWKTADFFQDKPVIILIEPVQDKARVQELEQRLMQIQALAEAGA